MSLATKSDRSASSPPSTSSTAQPEANTPTSIELVPVAQSVRSFWNRSANGTVATVILAPVISWYSRPRSSSRPGDHRPGPGQQVDLDALVHLLRLRRAAPAAPAPASSASAVQCRFMWLASPVRIVGCRPACASPGSALSTAPDAIGCRAPSTRRRSGAGDRAQFHQLRASAPRGWRSTCWPSASGSMSSRKRCARLMRSYSASVR